MIPHLRILCSVIQIVGFIALCASIHGLTPLLFKLIILGGLAPVVKICLPERSFLDVLSAACGIMLIGLTVMR